MGIVKKICVIGAGPCGLTAIKACREEDVDVVCLEKSDGIGGLWRYHDEDADGHPCVMKSTVINTSKELSSFSDFPPPKEYANFMHNKLMLKYIESYAEHFDLVKFVKFRQEVLKVEKDTDFSSTGRWFVTYKDLEEGHQKTDIFDGVMVCIGHHVYPNIPTFPGLNTFRGKKLHSHALKRADGFENMHVVVVGIGNSAVDAAVELTSVAEKVYLSTRRGSWILPRAGFGGEPIDLLLVKRSMDFANSLMPMSVKSKLMEWMLNMGFDHEKYKLKPKHSFFSAHPTLNDALPTRILTGRVIVKTDIERFEEDAVVFKNEKTAYRVDAVVFATGYHIKFPFIGPDVLRIENNSPFLYQSVFPPHLPHPSLAFIGLVQPAGSVIPIAEAQCRWFARLMRQKVKLPSRYEMEEEIKVKQKWMASTFVPSPRHTIEADYITYMNEICSKFGAKPNFLRMAVTDPKLFLACWFGPCTPYQYRLEGPHSWSGARDAVLSVHDRVNAPFNTCNRE